jgi:hypothetical protein
MCIRAVLGNPFPGLPWTVLFLFGNPASNLVLLGGGPPSLVVVQIQVSLVFERCSLIVPIKNVFK